MNETKINIQKAIDYIEDNLICRLDVRDISGVVYLSPFYFQRVFHATYGLPVGEYIRKRRLSLAGEELLTGGIIRVYGCERCIGGYNLSHGGIDLHRGFIAAITGLQQLHLDR